jgi:hypothetical protein
VHVVQPVTRSLSLQAAARCEFLEGKLDADQPGVIVQFIFSSAGLVVDYQFAVPYINGCVIIDVKTGGRVSL